MNSLTNPVGWALSPARRFFLSPNPFNGSTVILYDLPRRSVIRLTVHDLAGRELAVLRDGTLAAGQHALTWDARNYPAGVYIMRLTAGDEVRAAKVALVK